MVPRDFQETGAYREKKFRGCPNFFLPYSHGFVLVVNFNDTSN